MYFYCLYSKKEKNLLNDNIYVDTYVKHVPQNHTQLMGQ